MATKVENYLETRIKWRKGTDPEYPFVADFEGEKCLVRINDFPDENLYTLIVNGAEVESFDDWPKEWKKEK